ncbi:MAG: DUF5103 domain-containing protein [Cyclobacteriaceae bacterium]
MKNRAPFIILISGWLINSCVPVSNTTYTPDKKLIHDNVNYESKVGMVKLFPFSHNLQSDLENPVLNINNSDGFFLEFDLFEENYSNLNARFIHCNKNWSPSNLADIRFLDQYNSFTINDYQYSANTRHQYVKYGVRLPTPKISGNYLVVVSSASNDQDIIFSRRVLVFENNIGVNGSVKMSTSVAKRNANQQVDFNLSYKNLQNVNPLQDFHVAILQNHNWKVAIQGLKPTLIRHDQSYLEYFHFNSENNLMGLNEFRYFDLRSIDFRGMNVSNIQKNENSVIAFLGLDKPRTGLAYSQLIEDLNGNYFLVNSDPGDSQLQSEYVDVIFELMTDQIDGKVFVAGQFNNWQLTSQNNMTYDAKRNSYRAKIRLKQGYYDYMYWVDSENLPINHFEGNHFQTDNDYEILVYYRNPINNFDELAGYKALKTNF